MSKKKGLLDIIVKKINRINRRTQKNSGGDSER